ncbi:MAG: alanine racemase [Candidatus Omnitrophica bacterium]|nr:alanine racemase [Candidatus Omnitrophota bacterium]
MSRSPKNNSATTCVVDLAAIRHNIRCILGGLGPSARALLVVKAEAYGHGMVPVARAVSRVKEIALLGVATGAEALELRQAGIRKPVLVLGALPVADLPELIRKGVAVTLSTYDEAVRVDRIARRLGRMVKVHVEFDTGMGRLGVPYAEGLKLMFQINAFSSMQLEGMYTHFPSAETDDVEFSQKQIRIFSMAAELFREMYPRRLKYVHMANSAGIFAHTASRFNLVRPGLLAYGVNPFGKGRLPFTPLPAMSLKSRIALIKVCPKGGTVSYGRTYRARRRTHIAVLPVGYSSGYPFRLSNRSSVLIEGRRYPVAGRVTMDHLMIDLGPKTPYRAGQEVVLLGESGPKRITAEELARLAGTIPYEIVTGVHPKIRRVYKQ